MKNSQKQKMDLRAIWEKADEGCENHKEPDAGKSQSDPAFIQTNNFYFSFLHFLLFILWLINAKQINLTKGQLFIPLILPG